MKKLLILLFIPLCFGFRSATVIGTHAGSSGAAGATYITEDCFEDGSDADDLATYAAWSVATGSNGSAEIDDAANNDAGPCSGGSMSLLITPPTSSAKEYERTFSTASATFTISWVYEPVDALASGEYYNSVGAYDVADSYQFLFRIIQDGDADYDLRVYYDSDNSGTPDTYVDVCTDCVQDSGTTTIEVEITEGSDDKINSIWVGGTEYDNSGNGWNISDNDLDTLMLSTYASHVNTYRIDSLRSYEGVRNASY